MPEGKCDWIAVLGFAGVVRTTGGETVQYPELIHNTLKTRKKILH
jgi:hypothetical protein